MAAPHPEGKLQKDKGHSHLKASALLINGDYELVDVRDELVALSFPQPVCTLLQKLH